MYYVINLVDGQIETYRTQNDALATLQSLIEGYTDNAYFTAADAQEQIICIDGDLKEWGVKTEVFFT